MVQASLRPSPTPPDSMGSPDFSSDWLLGSPLARRLYHEVSARMPVVDYHTHVDPAALMANTPFPDPDSAWIAGDPYKHRTMRLLGVPEAEITGRVDPRARWQRWAECVPRLLGSPLHRWVTLELSRVFGIEEPLCPDAADRAWDAASERLAAPSGRPRELAVAAGVRVLCTSDGLLDPLDHHTGPSSLTQDAAGVEWRPSLRGDDLMSLGTDAGRAWLTELEATIGASVSSLADLESAMESQLDRFHRAGCRVADIGLDRVPEATSVEASSAAFDRWSSRGGSEDAPEEAISVAVITALARGCVRRGWTLLLHIGAQRQTSDRLRRLAGPAGGYAAMGPPTDTGRLAGMLNHLERQEALPRTVLFNLNPADNAAFATLTGSFARDGQLGYVSFGPAWWFNDHADGIVDQLDATAAFGLLATFPGMVSDARSLLSMHRHEYFRRVLCAWLARGVDEGRLPDSFDALSALLRAMLLNNPVRLLGLEQMEGMDG